MKQLHVVVLGLHLLLTCRCNPFLHLGPPVAIAPNMVDLLERNTATSSSSKSNLAVAIPMPTQSRSSSAVPMLEPLGRAVDPSIGLSCRRLQGLGLHTT
jgi:hypothetical protein